MLILINLHRMPAQTHSDVAEIDLPMPIQSEMKNLDAIAVDLNQQVSSLSDDHQLLKIAIDEQVTKTRFSDTLSAIQVSRSGKYKVFLNLDLNIPSGFTTEDYMKIFADTKMEPLIAPAVAAENELGINSLYILAHAAEESKWGTYQFAIRRNNYFGYGAIDSNPSNALSFDTVEEGVFHVVSKIKEDYLTEGGRFYSKRYGPTLTGMGQKYARNTKWAANIAIIMETIKTKVEKE